MQFATIKENKKKAKMTEKKIENNNKTILSKYLFVQYTFIVALALTHTQTAIQHLI